MTNFTHSQFRNGPVVLVSRPIQYTFPLSYAYLAGYLKKWGEAVRILFRPPVSQRELFAKQIVEMKPVLVGFGGLYPELAEIRRFIQALNSAGRRFPIVIGGQMVSPPPEFAVEITAADFGVVGEGEVVLHNLVTALREKEDPASVKGLVVKYDNSYTFTGPGE